MFFIFNKEILSNFISKNKHLCGIHIASSLLNNGNIMQILPITSLNNSNLLFREMTATDAPLVGIEIVSTAPQIFDKPQRYMTIGNDDKATRCVGRQCDSLTVQVPQCVGISEFASSKRIGAASCTHSQLMSGDSVSPFELSQGNPKFQQM